MRTIAFDCSHRCVAILLAYAAVFHSMSHTAAAARNWPPTGDVEMRRDARRLCRLAAAT